MLAAVNSGLSLLAISSPTNEDNSDTPSALMESIEADPPLALTGSKAVALTVITFIASLDLTVAMQLPAYMGRLKVSSDTTSVISEICCTSSKALTLGKTFFPKVVAGANICE